MYAYGKDHEFMKKLEQRRNLEQSYAQSQETDNNVSLVHHSQQPLMGVCVYVCVCVMCVMCVMCVCVCVRVCV